MVGISTSSSQAVHLGSKSTDNTLSPCSTFENETYEDKDAKVGLRL